MKGEAGESSACVYVCVGIPSLYAVTGIRLVT